MSKSNVEFKKNDEYYTPVDFVNNITGGGIDYDPATNDFKASQFGVENYDTIETDGLKTDWSVYKKIWVNPPFTIKRLFVEKAVASLTGDNKIYILVPIETLTTKWFAEAVKEVNYDLYLPNGRVKFENPDNPEAKSPAFGSVVIELGKEASGVIKRVRM